MRALVRAGRYVLTTHGQEAMEDDDLTIFDVERCVLTGLVRERQRDRETGDWKYLVEGATLAGANMATVVKVGRSGRLVILTVYVFEEET